MRTLVSTVLVVLFAIVVGLAILRRPAPPLTSASAVSPVAPTSSKSRSTASSRAYHSFSSTSDISGAADQTIESASDKDDLQPSTATTIARERRIADLVQLYRTASDSDAREEILDELAQMPERSAAEQLVAMFREEKDAEGQLEIIQALAHSEQNEAVVDALLAELKPAYDAATDEEIRVAIQDVFSETDSPLSIDFLQAAYDDKSALPLERVNAAEAMLRLDTRNSSFLTEIQSQALVTDLRLQAQAANDSPEVRERVVMALAERRGENTQFFQQMLATEQDANVRRLLEKLSVTKAQQITAAPNVSVKIGG